MALVEVAQIIQNVITMLNRFAYFAIGLSVLGVLFAIGEPYILRLQTQYQFHDFITDTAAEQVANHKLQPMILYLVFGFLFSSIGIFAGFGLLRRRTWARKVWLSISAIWFVLSIVPEILSQEPPVIVSPLFRLIVFVVSLIVLCNPAVRADFIASPHNQSRR